MSDEEYHQIEYGADFDLEGSVDHVLGTGDSIHDHRAMTYVGVS